MHLREFLFDVVKRDGAEAGWRLAAAWLADKSPGLDQQLLRLVAIRGLPGLALSTDGPDTWRLAQESLLSILADPSESPAARTEALAAVYGFPTACAARNPDDLTRGAIEDWAYAVSGGAGCRARWSLLCRQFGWDDRACGNDVLVEPSLIRDAPSFPADIVQRLGQILEEPLAGDPTDGPVRIQDHALAVLAWFNSADPDALRLIDDHLRSGALTQAQALRVVADFAYEPLATMVRRAATSCNRTRNRVFLLDYLRFRPGDAAVFDENVSQASALLGSSPGEAGDLAGALAVRSCIQWRISQARETGGVIESLGNVYRRSVRIVLSAPPDEARLRQLAAESAGTPRLEQVLLEEIRGQPQSAAGALLLAYIAEYHAR